MFYYLFVRDGIIVEVKQFINGRAASEYCEARYGQTALVCCVVGGQDGATEYRHLVAPHMTLTETEQ